VKKTKQKKIANPWDGNFTEYINTIADDDDDYDDDDDDDNNNNNNNNNNNKFSLWLYCWRCRIVTHSHHLVVVITLP